MASVEESTVSVTMARDDKSRFGEITRDMGMTQKVAIGRLITWFQEQEPMIRSLVMGHIPEDYEGDVIDLIYRKRSEEKDSKERVAKTSLEGLAKGRSKAHQARDR